MRWRRQRCYGKDHIKQGGSAAIDQHSSYFYDPHVFMALERIGLGSSSVAWTGDLQLEVARMQFQTVNLAQYVVYPQQMEFKYVGFAIKGIVSLSLNNYRNSGLVVGIRDMSRDAPKLPHP